MNLNRTVLREQLKEILLKRILSGEYEPGDMHRPVLEALAEGDAERAGLLLRQHVEHFGELILKEDR